mmetsp:Transcript_45917/g.121756  ORF Transcript_45917/g.121756 Transcript_45917/m.121756 type:complete len:609 (-) Transcript_45917:138-1964(-)
MLVILFWALAAVAHGDAFSEASTVAVLTEIAETSSEIEDGFVEESFSPLKSFVQVTGDIGDFPTLAEPLLGDGTISTTGKVGIGILIFGWACFFCAALWQAVSFAFRSRRGRVQEDPGYVEETTLNHESWSIWGLFALTTYRFYSGFLTASWLPFVLAKEGKYIMNGNQTLFMAIAKFIYACTILCNPGLGLVGDHLITFSHGSGRRLYILFGVSIAGTGCLCCIIANNMKNLPLMLCGIFLWRMGEAVNDVTTEALVPELLPPSQYQAGAAVKSAVFLLGGLINYIIMIIWPRIHFSYFYYMYLVGMLLGALPPLLLLNRDKIPGQTTTHIGASFRKSLVQAYLSPARYPGGFPWACLAVCCFGLGVAPMFFLLLIVRDVVGITDSSEQSRIYARSALLFFLAAGVSCAVGALDKRASPAMDRDRKYRGKFLVFTNSMCGIIALLIPFLNYAHETSTRVTLFYLGCALYGSCFGSSFSRFQDTSWELLPPNADWGNAMGFNVMARNFGVGMGNVIAGIELDPFRLTDPSIPNLVQYGIVGYFLMGGTCCAAILFAASFGWKCILAGLPAEETRTSISSRVSKEESTGEDNLLETEPRVWSFEHGSDS